MQDKRHFQTNLPCVPQLHCLNGMPFLENAAVSEKDFHHETATYFINGECMEAFHCTSPLITVIWCKQN